MVGTRRRQYDDTSSPVPRKQRKLLNKKAAVAPQVDDQADANPSLLQSSSGSTVGEMKTAPNSPFIKTGYDVCFGLLMVTAFTSSSWRERPEQAPLQVSYNGNALILRYQGSGEHAAILMSEPLARLVKEYSVSLTATMPQARHSKKKTSYKPSVSARSVRLIVYGFLSDKDMVSRILDEASLFLQCPDEFEYDRTVKYVNPMYLLRPGEEMPMVDNTPRGGSLGQTAPPIDDVELGELEKSQIMRIFDEACEENLGTTVQVTQSPRIVSTLKEHQLEALAAMIEREQGVVNEESILSSLWEAPHGDEGMARYRHTITASVHKKPLPVPRGGILADEMGLGKTLSALALICHHLDAIEVSPRSGLTRTSLIVTPKSTIHGWKKQIDRHIRAGGMTSFVYHGSKRQDTACDLHTFDVVITTYDTLRSDLTTSGPLYKRIWSRVILDEAHRIRNRFSKTYLAVCGISAQNRWCLTGTPIQNSLDDFGSLVSFIRVPFLSTRDEFRFWISSPIHKNQSNSLRTLGKLIRATCLRRMKYHPRLFSTLKLPSKIEQQKVVELSLSERKLYKFFQRRSYLLAEQPDELGASPKANTTAARKRGAGTKERHKKEHLRNMNHSRRILVLLSVLRMICDHGETLLPPIALQAWQKRDAQTVDLALLQATAESTQECCICGMRVIYEDDEKGQVNAEEFSCGTHVACETCAGRIDDGVLQCPKCLDGRSIVSATATTPETNTLSYSPSSKVAALLENIRATLYQRSQSSANTARPPIKSVIFSQWTRMLDQVSLALIPLLASFNVNFVRIDGSCSLQQRSSALDKFNSDSGCVIMLATVGAVGEGIDLSVASEVHLLEPHWNPMAEAQAVDRVHRIGQTKEVKITRYCVKDSIEEYIQWVQHRKKNLINESLGSAGHGQDTAKREEKLIEEKWKKLLRYLS